MTASTRQQSHSGFTLVELIICLVIPVVSMSCIQPAMLTLKVTPKTGFPRNWQSFYPHFERTNA